MLKAIIMSLIAAVAASTMFVLFSYVSPARAAEPAPQTQTAPADCASVAAALGYLTATPALVDCSLE